MISIIVAIYNVEKYLKACLDSILNSSFTDYELILIDDGSTDTSGLICDQYAQHDSRIIVIHQQNGGIYAARNTGLNKSRGDYILMIDGDDCIHPQMIEVLFNFIISGDYDFSMIRGEMVPHIFRMNLIRKTIAEKAIKVIDQVECFQNCMVMRTLKYNIK